MRLRRATRKATRTYDKYFADVGISIAQFGILQTISLGSKKTITQIADDLDMERTTLTRNLNPLISQGWVALTDGPDKRSRSVSLTPQGLEILKDGRKAWTNAQKNMRENMGTQDLDELHRLLAQLLNRLPPL